MTVNELQKCLIKEIEQITKEMSFLDCERNPASMKGYSQAIPIFSVFRETDSIDKEPLGEDSLFPYFVVRADSVEYQADDKDGQGNRVRIMIVFAVMDEDPDMNGYYTLTAAVERVIERFQRNQSLEAFWCSRRMNVAYQEDDTFPHFFAGIEMIWYIPEIEQEEMW